LKFFNVESVDMTLKYMFLAFSLVVCGNFMAARSPLIGKPAPLFKAPMVCPDGSLHICDLKKYIGNNIVLYFYPMDNTPGCSKQAECFCRSMDRLQDADIVLIGISCDSIKSHMNFQKKYSIWYPLVSDSRWKRTISKMYDAAGFLYSKRKTFLINKKGNVFKVFEQVTIENQIDDILNSFAAENRKKK
jgi:thioredoxin-dependent peroxiredoxin